MPFVATYNNSSLRCSVSGVYRDHLLHAARESGPVQYCIVSYCVVASLASTGTTYSTLPASLAQQLYHTEVTEVLLVSDQHGYGFSLNAGAFPSDLLTEPPVINQVSENSAAERFVVFRFSPWPLRVSFCMGVGIEVL